MEFTAYRVSNWDAPLWVNENRQARRYNYAMRGPVQYWSLHPLTPWAEIIRSLGIRTTEDLASMRQRLWAARFRIEVDEIKFTSASRFELPPEDLVSDDYAACQRLGSSRLGLSLPNGIIVPSAALPGTQNLVIFGPMVRIPYLGQPLGDEDVPSSLAAEGARPPESLLPMVCHFGDTHAGLDAWKHAEDFSFQEPSADRL